MSSNTLTDAQLVLLSSAARHAEGAIELELKGAAAKKVVGKLLREGLIEEVPSRGTLPVWRRDDNQGSLALCITKKGLAGVEASASAPSSKAPPGTQNASDVARKQPRRAQSAKRKESKDGKLQRWSKSSRGGHSVPFPLSRPTLILKSTSTDQSLACITGRIA